jgi:hypothetical protein
VLHRLFGKRFVDRTDVVKIGVWVVVQFSKRSVDRTDVKFGVWVVVRLFGLQRQRNDEVFSLDNEMLVGPRAFVELAGLFGSVDGWGKVDFHGSAPCCERGSWLVGVDF